MLVEVQHGHVVQMQPVEHVLELALGVVPEDDALAVGVEALGQGVVNALPVVHRASQHAADQSSRVSPLILSNSARLFVTRTASIARACAAIQRSLPPIGVPAAFRRLDCSA